MTWTETEIREQYRSLALDWAAALGEPRRANRIFKKHHAFYKEVRNLDAGRRAIESLLFDSEPDDVDWGWFSTLDSRWRWPSLAWVQ